MIFNPQFLPVLGFNSEEEFVNSDSFRSFFMRSLEDKTSYSQGDRVAYWFKKGVKNRENFLLLFQKGFEANIGINWLIGTCKPTQETYALLENAISNEFASLPELCSAIQKILPPKESPEILFEQMSNEKTFKTDNLRFLNPKQIKELIKIYEQNLTWKSFGILGLCLSALPKKENEAERKRTFYDEKYTVYTFAVPPGHVSFAYYPKLDAARLVEWFSERIPEKIRNNKEIVRWFFGTIINEAGINSGVISTIKRNYEGVLKREIFDLIDTKFGERKQIWAEKFAKIFQYEKAKPTDEQFAKVKFTFKFIEEFLFMLEDIENSYGNGVPWHEPYRNIISPVHNLMEAINNWHDEEREIEKTLKSLYGDSNKYGWETVVRSCETIYSEMQKKSEQWKNLTDKYPQFARALKNGTFNWHDSELFRKQFMNFADENNRKPSSYVYGRAVGLQAELQELADSSDLKVLGEMFGKLLKGNVEFYRRDRDDIFVKRIDVSKESVFGLSDGKGVPLLTDGHLSQPAHWSKDGSLIVKDNKGRTQKVCGVGFDHKLRDEIRFDMIDMIKMSHYGLIPIFEEIQNEKTSLREKMSSESPSASVMSLSTPIAPPIENNLTSHNLM